MLVYREMRRKVYEVRSTRSPVDETEDSLPRFEAMQGPAFAKPDTEAASARFLRAAAVLSITDVFLSSRKGQEGRQYFRTRHSRDARRQASKAVYTSRNHLIYFSKSLAPSDPSLCLQLSAPPAHSRTMIRQDSFITTI